MSLDLSKIKQQALDQEAANKITKQKEDKIQDFRKSHKDNIIKFFINSFPKENVIMGNGGNNYKVSFGPYSVQLQFNLGKFEKGIMKPNKNVDFYFSKYLDNQELGIAQFNDLTDYDNQNISTNDYSYSVVFDKTTTTVNFEQLSQILQEITNK